MKQDYRKEDYKNMQEELLPDMEKRNELWKNIEKKAADRKKKQKYHYFKLAGGIAAAVFVLAFCIPQTNLADNVYWFVQKYFYKNVDLEKDVYHDIYEDQDEHIKMQIREMLSDGACIYMDIVYEALDEEGAKWLSDMEFDMDSIRFVDIEDTIGYAFYLTEQEDLATSNARYFTYLLQDGSGNFHLKDVTQTLFYPMYRSQGIGTVELKCNLNTVSYWLKADATQDDGTQEKPSLSEYYEPNYFMASKLSFGLFGLNHGAIIEGKDEYGVEYTEATEEFLAEQEKNDDMEIIFTMKDGSRFKLSGLIYFSHSVAINIPQSDYLICSGGFETEDNDSVENPKRVFINPDELASIEINGIHYELVKDE